MLGEFLKIFVFLTIFKPDSAYKRGFVRHFTIQPAAHIDPPFGTDKSVPYEWMEHFTIQPTVPTTLNRINAPLTEQSQ